MIAGQSDGEGREVWPTKSVCSWSKFLKQKLWHERYRLPATSQEIAVVVADASSNPRWKSILHESNEITNFYSEKRSCIPDREPESRLSLSIASAWSSMKIFLNDVTAKFVCVSLSEELLAEGSSSIGGVRSFD